MHKDLVCFFFFLKNYVKNYNKHWPCASGRINRSERMFILNRCQVTEVIRVRIIYLKIIYVMVWLNMFVFLVSLTVDFQLL